MSEANTYAGYAPAPLGTVPSPPYQMGDCIKAVDYVFSNLQKDGGTKWALIRSHLEALGYCGEREPSEAEKRFDRTHERMAARRDLWAAFNEAQPMLPEELQARMMSLLARASRE